MTELKEINPLDSGNYPEKIVVDIDIDKIISKHIETDVIKQVKKLYNNLNIKFDPKYVVKKSDNRYEYNFILPKVEVKEWNFDKELTTVTKESDKFAQDYLDRLPAGCYTVLSTKDKISYYKKRLKSDYMPLHHSDKPQFRVDSKRNKSYLDSISQMKESDRLELARLQKLRIREILLYPFTLFQKSKK